MKNILILFIALLLIGCNKTDQKRIVGKWEIYAKDHIPNWSTVYVYEEYSTPIEVEFTSDNYELPTLTIPYTYVGSIVTIDGTDNTIVWTSNKEFNLTYGVSETITLYYRK